MINVEDFIDYHIEGEHNHEINIKSGALNQALINRLTEISVSDDWDEVKHEWRATGNVWYRPMRYINTEYLEIPEPHRSNHPNYCVCGHPIAWHFEVENTENDLFPFLVTIPLQKLAYYSALKKGYDIDKPRNLAKSVTVE